MAAFLVEDDYDMPIRDEPEVDYSVLDPRLPWVGDSSGSEGREGDRS
jgi:hypothetical protein